MLIVSMNTILWARVEYNALRRRIKGAVGTIDTESRNRFYVTSRAYDNEVHTNTCHLWNNEL